MCLDKYRKIIRYALNLHKEAPFTPSSDVPIHRWFLIPEASSLRLIDVMLREAGVVLDQYNFIFDPFSGSGTTALYSMLHGINFVGGDKLADLTVSTIVKSIANNVAIQDVILGARIIMQRLQRYGELLDSLYDDASFAIAQQIQNIVLNISASLSTKLVLLLPIYSSLRMTPLHTTTSTAFLHEYSFFLNMVIEDLMNSSYLTSPIQTAIYCGDCCATNFTQMMLDTQNQQNAPSGILITSPTFVSTSQIVNGRTAYSHWLAAAALSEFNMLSRYRSTFRQFDVRSSIGNYISSQHKAVREFLYALACVLAEFQQFTHAPSLAIIEFENSHPGKELLELDLMICQLASLMDFSPRFILVTHYLDDAPNVPVYYATEKRGGFVVLDR